MGLFDSREVKTVNAIVRDINANLFSLEKNLELSKGRFWEHIKTEIHQLVILVSKLDTAIQRLPSNKQNMLVANIDDDRIPLMQFFVAVQYAMNGLVKDAQEA